MKKISPYYAGLILYLLAMYFGINLSYHGGDGRIVLFGGSRVPAAFQELPRFNDYQGFELQEKAKLHLLASTKFSNYEDGMQVSLGQFYFTDPVSKQPNTPVCNVYETVKLKFRAKGMFVHSSIKSMRPRLMISAPCLQGLDNSNNLAPIKIPMKTLMRDYDPPSDEKLGGILFVDGRLIIGENLSDSWPITWELEEISLEDYHQLVQPLTVDVFSLNPTLGNSDNPEFTWDPLGIVK